MKRTANIKVKENNRGLIPYLVKSVVTKEYKEPPSSPSVPGKIDIGIRQAVKRLQEYGIETSNHVKADVVTLILNQQLLSMEHQKRAGVPWQYVLPMGFRYLPYVEFGIYLREMNLQAHIGKSHLGGG